MSTCLRARAISLVFENFTRAYLFQIALEMMCLTIQIASNKKRSLDRVSVSLKLEHFE